MRGMCPHAVLASLGLIIVLGTNVCQAQFEGLDVPSWATHCTLENKTKPCRAGSQCAPCLRSNKCPEGVGECLPCLMGDYCPNGTTNEYFWTVNALCRGGEICRNSSASEVCPPGFFCPQGTFYLSEFHACRDDLGIFCGAGSKRNTTGCKAGYYCPNSYSRYLCPKGYFCKEFSMAPTKCNFGSHCPEGSTSAQTSTVGVVASVCGLFFALLLILVAEAYLKHRQRKLQEAMNQRVLTKSTGKTVLAKLLGIPLASLAEEVTGFEPKTKPMTIRIEHLQLTMGKKMLLEDITGTFAAGALVAVMGPSGCGKSTLLNTLTGNARYGNRKGTIFINGKEADDLDDMNKVVGFVPQDDTVFGSLTVFENLAYSARLRLQDDVAKNKAKVQSLVTGTIALLGLENQQNSIVGTVEKRGISGGQKKRVNIGVEMVADPTILLMDEPTSGLGATDTVIIMKGSKSFSFLHRTVVAVIHQPRYSVFTLFHTVMLLGRGGRMVFTGPSGLAVKYFESMGFPLPPNENPADFFLDVISNQVQLEGGRVLRENELFQMWDEYEDSGKKQAREAEYEASTKVAATPEGLPPKFMHTVSSKWKEFADADADGSGTLDAMEFLGVLNGVGLNLKKSDAEKVLIMFDKDGSGTVEFNEFLSTAADQYRMLNEVNVILEPKFEGNPAKRRTPAVVDQFLVFFERASLQWLRDLRVNALDIFLVMAAAVVVGALLGSNWGYREVASNACMSTVTIGVLSSVSALKLFGDERVNFWREKASGVSTLAYFMAKILLNMLDGLWRPALFLTLYYNFLLPNTFFVEYLAILVCVCFACSGIGILFSAIFKPQAALLMGVIFPLVTGVFLAGVNNPTLAEMTPTLKFVSGISFTRWASEAITIAELQTELDYQNFRVTEVYKRLDYDPSHRTDCFVALIVMGLVYRFVAFWCMSDHIKDLLDSFADVVDDHVPDLGFLDEDEDDDQSSSVVGRAARKVGKRMSAVRQSFFAKFNNAPVAVPPPPPAATPVANGNGNKAAKVVPVSEIEEVDLDEEAPNPRKWA